MEKEIIPLNINSYDYKNRKKLLEALGDFYFPNYKLQEEEHTFDIFKRNIIIGTIVRIKSDNIWYDIPYKDFIEIDIRNKDNNLYLFNFYKEFLKKVYLTKHFYIVRKEYDFKSVLQITEEQRLKETYYD